MDPLDFYRESCAPVIDGLRLHKSQENFRSGLQLTFATMIHESGGLRYRDQIGGGPGHGLGQIEGATVHSFRENWLAFRPEYISRIIDVSGASDPDNWYEELLRNDRLAVALTRMLFYRRPEPLPLADDLLGHAGYWKQFYNTAHGDGTLEEFVRDARHHAEWLYPERVWEEAAKTLKTGDVA